MLFRSDDLRPLINCENADWPLVKSWLVACLMPSGAYPILCWEGPQGSAKSTSSKLCKRLIDPNTVEEARHRSWRLLSTVRPMKFNESEWHLPREQGIPCLRQVIRTLEQRNEVYFPLEFRFVKADDAWLSPFYQRETCSIAVHASADEAYQYLLTDINPLFRAHQGRPHWGKLHWMGAAELSTMYPRWQDFQRVRQQFDPQGQMLNAHLRKLFLKA